VHAPWQAFAAATLASAGGAPLIGAYNTLLSTVVDPAEQQRFFGLAFATLNLGLGVGGLIGGIVADEHRPGSFQMLYVLDAAALVASGLLVLGAVRAGERTLGGSEQSATGGYRQVLRDAPFRRFLVLGVVLMSCAYAQLEFGLPAFAVDVAHVSPRVLGWSFAANSVTIVATQAWVLRRIEHRSRTKVLSIVGVIFATAWVILALGAATRSVSTAAPVVGVAVCAVVFALAEVLMSPVIPALTNVLASDAYRGRYNALSSMLFGATAIIGPLTAAPLIGHGLAAFWTVLVVGGSLTAAALALRLRPQLTPEQDGIAGNARPHGAS
jgi:MFS family permease